MHIHGSIQNIQNIQGANFNSISSRNAAAERAAEVRKRLLKSTATIDGQSPDESQLIGHWLDARHSQVQSQGQYRDAATGEDPDLS